MPEIKSYQNTKKTKLFDIEMILDQKRGQLLLKRIFDILISFIGLVALCPLLLIIAIIIKIDSMGPIFFKQVRVGKCGEEFKIYKFRTMILDAENKGMQITVGKDKRITKSGHILRKTKLDELPQLINVFKGDMSFVGPRPEVPKYVALYDNQQKNILRVRPGITDLASIEYRDENTLLAKSNDPEKTYIEEIMIKKIELNIEYLSKMSVLYDIKLILKTILVIMK
ncbi:sugar transferase [Alkalihalobacterium alkalinitrilicum]|uniref:sugar transferase n=1 Tax=Alkalihalobacterium alkalinitrilicum TaxID=427920 RepID=UPI001EE49D38|nr:sugar transferase [Alkalihalobacterium alkalinitrilicum]